MKKLFAIIISTMFLSSFAYAGSCPMLLKQVDAKIASSKLAPEALQEVKTLRDNGGNGSQNG